MNQIRRQKNNSIKTVKNTVCFSVNLPVLVKKCGIE